ncbi:cytochrome P450 [Aspergillus tetrazonus]
MGITAYFCGALLLLLWYRVLVRHSVDKTQVQLRQNIILVKNMPYAIPTPEAYQVHFSSATHIKQLIQAPDAHLSLHALAKDMFQPTHTMDGLTVDDCMSANGTIHQRALQAELRSQLPALTQPLSECIARTLTKEVSQASGSPAAFGDGWRALQLFPLAKRLVVSANALVFFGPEVSSNPIFLNAALEYPEHMMQTAETLRLLPSALTVLLDTLIPIVERRLLENQSRPEQAEAPVPRDCIQFFVNAVKHKKQLDKWHAQRIVQVLLGIWFASVHQPAMCLFYALDDLCLHPEYVVPLREKISQALQIDLSTLPLLDAFLKESARLHPTDSISVRRKALRPFVFSDGTNLAKGDVACIPMQPALQNPESYVDPLTFNPHRFLKDTMTSTNLSSSRSRFTDVDVAFPIWGLGKHACPGRLYASLLLKLVLAHVLLRFEIKLPDGNRRSEKRSFYWRSAIVPRSGAVLYFRERGSCTE